MSGTGYAIERDGKSVPATMEEWAEFDKHRFIATDVVGKLRLVTFFEGIDPMAGFGAPFQGYYRTGVLNKRKLLEEVETETREEALAVHDKILKEMEAGTWQPGKRDALQPDDTLQPR